MGSYYFLAARQRPTSSRDSYVCLFFSQLKGLKAFSVFLFLFFPTYRDMVGYEVLIRVNLALDRATNFLLPATLYLLTFFSIFMWLACQ